jgi:hypothetical protein
MSRLRYPLPTNETPALTINKTLTIPYRDFLLEVEKILKPQITKIQKLDSGASNQEIITALNELIDGLTALKIMEK